MKLKTVLLFCLLMRFASSHANMASPFIEGTMSSSAISSKDVHILSESIVYIIDKDFNTAKVIVEYTIQSELVGKQIPLLFHALDFKDSFNVWLDGKKIKIININDSDSKSNIFHQFGQPIKKANNEVEITIYWLKNAGYVYKARDLKYFKADLQKGIHKVHVEYTASSWIVMSSYVAEKSFRYSLTPAKYWKSFGKLNVSVIQKGEPLNYYTNLGTPLEQKIHKENTWQFDSLPVEFIELSLKPNINKTAQFFIDLGEFKLSLIFGLLLACIHIFIIYRFREKMTTLRKILLLHISSILVPIITIIFYIISSDIIDFLIGEAASGRHGYWYGMEMQFLIITLIYWMIIFRIYNNMVPKLSIIILVSLSINACTNHTTPKENVTVAQKIQDELIKTSNDTMPQFETEEYRRLAVSFIKQNIQIDAPKNTAVLYQTYNSLNIDHILKDTGTWFGKMQHDTQNIYKLKHGKWLKKEFPAYKMISKAEFDSIISNDKYDYFHKNAVHKFTFPVFLDNGKYCIWSREFECGPWNNKGDTLLFEYKNGKWEKVLTFSKWVS